MMGSNFGIPKKDSYVRERFYSLLAIDIKSSVLVELTEVLPWSMPGNELGIIPT